MFRKVLKYDIASMIRIWSILSATVLVFGVIGGLCFRGMEATAGNMVESGTLSQMVFIPLYVLGIIISIISIVAYGVATTVLILVRFYRNFFTDEGYLTFTLPVKRVTLFNSKLLMSFIYQSATTLITVVSVTVLLAIAPGGELGGSALEVIFAGFGDIRDYFLPLIKSETEIGIWLGAYLSVGLVYVLVFFVHQTLLLFCTVTFGSILAKKHKILTSVAVYYGVQMLLSTFWSIFQSILYVGMEALAIAPESIMDGTQILWLLLGGMIYYVCMLALIATFFYKFAINKLRGNLNLA